MQYNFPFSNETTSSNFKQGFYFLWSISQKHSNLSENSIEFLLSITLGYDFPGFCFGSSMNL